MAGPIELRQYQLDCIAQDRALVQQGHRAILNVSPTGSGKTTIAGKIVEQAVARGTKVLWCAHRSELIDQAADRLKEFGVESGVISASSSKAPNPYHLVQVASVQTLMARKLRPEAQLVVLDECHHYPSDEWSQLAKDYSKSVLLGFTATPERSDGRGLGAVFSQIVVVASVRQLVTDGHLVTCDIVRPASKLRPGKIAQRPVDAYLAHAKGRKTICFSPSVMAAELHASEFNAAGVDARVVSGKTPKGERSTLMAAFKAGEFPVLVNCYVATEGFDVPAVDCVILARSCGTIGTFLQMVGRGLRPAPGKQDCVLIDLHGVSHVHGHPEDDREYSLDGKGISNGTGMAVDMTGSCRVCKGPVEPGETCPECGTEAKEQEAPKVTGDPLVKFAAKRREGEEKRAATLARWILGCKEKGHRPGAAYYKFAAVYGEKAPASIVAEAMRLVREREAVDAIRTNDGAQSLLDALRGVGAANELSSGKKGAA